MQNYACYDIRFLSASGFNVSFFLSGRKCTASSSGDSYQHFFFPKNGMRPPSHTGNRNGLGHFTLQTLKSTYLPSSEYNCTEIEAPFGGANRVFTSPSQDWHANGSQLMKFLRGSTEILQNTTGQSFHRSRLSDMALIVCNFIPDLIITLSGF